MVAVAAGSFAQVWVLRVLSEQVLVPEVSARQVSVFDTIWCRVLMSEFQQTAFL